MTTSGNDQSYAAAANKLMTLLSDVSNIWVEPARIRRGADAQAEASKTLTKAEIETEQIKSDARYRMEVVEMRRQRNLSAITKALVLENGGRLEIEDKDWLADFVESAKDTGSPTIQEIWAKLLAGEVEEQGSYSKRTLHMVKSLSQSEAVLIKDACRKVCCLEEAGGRRVLFINVVVQRLEGDFAQNHPLRIMLFEENSEEVKKVNQKLMNCGFLGGDDFDFNVDGEGHLIPEKFELSQYSPRKITMGTKMLVMDPLQPGLLLEMPDETKETLRMRTPAASIAFSAWKLTPEGEELFWALNQEPDLGVLATLGDALTRGGLSVTEAG